MGLLRRYEDQIYAAMRIVVGFLFVSHGVQKVFRIIEGGGEMPTDWSWTELRAFLSLYPAGLIETVGGALITIGLFTRWTAFICSGQMAVAYFMAHQPHGLIPLLNRGDVAVLLCFIFLLMAAKGAGIWSLDALRGAGSSAQEAGSGS